MAVDHGLLHGMQGAVGATQVFDGEERAAVERRQELDAGIDRFQREAAVRIQFADDNRAGAAVAFRAAFLGAGAMQILTQVLEHGARRRDARDLTDGPLVIKADGLRCHGESERQCGPGARYAWGRAKAGLAHVDRHPVPKIALPCPKNISHVA